MTPERWQQINDLYHEALELDANQQATFLNQACGGDARLRDEVESLIAAHDQARSFIAEPAFKVAARALADDQATSLVGRSFSRYRIESLLGVGGMGEVYLAEDTSLRRKVALKLLPAYFTRDAERLRRFELEAHAASALNHPNILTIHEIGQVDGHHYMATEFIDGETLREHMAGTRMKLDESLDIAAQVASALAAAHDAGIVHRDVKPENIMLRRDRIVKVLDFGLAKLAPRHPFMAEPDAPTKSKVKTNPGVVMGTVGYMSPEQARGLEVDARTDVWSLGVVLYEMVTGRAPFEGETPSHVIVSIMESEPPPLARDTEVPAELEQIITKALRKERSERYKTARDFALDLKNLQQELEVEARMRRSLEPEKPEGGVRNTLSIKANPISSVAYFVGEIKRHKRGATLVAAAAVIAFAIVAYSSFPSNRAPGSSSDAIESVAVLPFVNVSGDPNTEYLSDGIADSIISSLSRLPALKVMSLNSVLRYKGKQIDAQAVGRELNVRAVLIGKLTKPGDDLAITIELVDVRDNRRLWGGQYNRKLSNILVVQDEIARELSERLRLRLTNEEQKQLAKRYTNNAEAYQLYLKGRFFWNKRTEDGFRRGVEHFRQAVEKYPNYALAYAGLADSFIGLTFYNFAAPHETMPKAKEAALNALAIDNTLAEAHTSLAHILMNYDRNWSEAEKEFKLSIELNPDYARAHQWYAIHYLTAKGRLEEALHKMKRALELDPDSLVMNTFMGATLHFAGRHDEAIEQCRKTLEMDPNFAVAHWHIGLAYEQKGMFDEAIAEFQKASTLSGGSPLMKAALGHAYAKANRKREATVILDQLKELSKERYVSSYEVAAIYVALGDHERAFQLLERADKEHSFHLVYLKAWPQFSPVSADPRFQDLVQRIGL